jgi:acetyl esterase/lipase
MASLPRLTLDDVAPDLRRFAERMPRLPLERDWVRRMVRLIQPLVRAKPTDGVNVELHRAAPRMWTHRPDQVRSNAALFWIHGGGYIIGNPKNDAQFCGGIAAAHGITVFAPAYRLAPGHPFPAPLDDLFAAWRWVLAQAGAWGIDPARIVIGGESAGGGLAAALVQRIHDEGGIQPVGQLLFCPMLDDRTAARRELDARRHYVWDNKMNAAGWGAYLGAEPGGDAPPTYAVSARREDLSGLPPAWIGVGSIDLFRDEDIEYARRLKAAGVPVDVVETPGGFHAFNKLAPDIAISQAFEAAANDWLRAVLTE